MVQKVLFFIFLTLVVVLVEEIMFDDTKNNH